MFIFKKASHLDRKVFKPTKVRKVEAKIEKKTEVKEKIEVTEEEIKPEKKQRSKKTVSTEETL